MSVYPNNDRRTNPRVRVQAEVLFSLLIPHETFSPRTYRGTTLDVSLGGMCFRCPNVPKDVYRQVLRGLSHAKLEVRFPTHEDPILLRGKIVWVDYHDPAGGKPAYCNFGVSYYSFTPEALSDYRQILEEVDRRTSQAVAKQNEFKTANLPRKNRPRDD